MLDITFNKHYESAIVTRNQGYNSKNVILDVYCSVQSLGGNVNTRRMSKSDMGFIFHIKKQ